MREIDLYEFLLRGVRSDVDRLLPGDTILVPPVGPQVTVAGMVRRPAIYELKGEPGLKRCSRPCRRACWSRPLCGRSRVERIEAHERRTMLSAQLPEGSTQEAAAKALAGFPMQDGDQVLVAPILPYNEKAVYLEGHVFRPGKYPYRDGMTVNDLLRSYQDVMPEPADHAEIIRLQPPDFRPATIGFQLVGGPQRRRPGPPAAIRCHSRVQPLRSRSAEGIYLRRGASPGRISDGEWHDSGGAGEYGGRIQAQCLPRNRRSLQLRCSKRRPRCGRNRRLYSLARRMEGDKNADLLLKPGDVLSIRQLTGWKDIGASVDSQG